MATYYHGVYQRPDTCSGTSRMYIQLYPNTPNELNYVKSGTTVTTALRNAADQLYNHGSISHYDIIRFHAEDYNYPNVDTGSRSTIANQFEDYLRGTTDSGTKNNGTGMNLKDVKGCHLLVHNGSCEAGIVGGEYADDCTAPSSFSRGVMGWTSVACNNSGLVRNSAIQETLHSFIREKHSGVKSLTGSNDDEHTLGKMMLGGDGAYRISPMLTYHFNQRGKGNCQSNTDTKNGFTETLTSCTKDAVDIISNDQCNNPGPC